MTKKRTMWWNLPPEEIDELEEKNLLQPFTVVEYDTDEKENGEWKEIKKENSNE